MKKNRFKNTILNLKKSVERFPITIFLSTALVVLLIVFHERPHTLTQVQIDDFVRLNMLVGLSVLLSLCIGLLTEKELFTNTFKKVFSYVLGAIILLLYYFLLLPNFDFTPMARYIGFALLLIISSFYIPWIKRKENFEYYVIKVFSSLLVTFVYSGVLCFGLFAILFTTDQLFDLSIDGKYYYYIFLFVSLIFALALFLSKIPGSQDDLKDYSYSKSLKVLLLYIIIPLISVYTLILYVYFAKILITSQWPKGLVSHLVLWYSSISVGVIFLISPILKDNPVGRIFKNVFPKVIIPILAMMFVSIGIRMNQYGITENRYFVVLLGLWVLGIMLYYALAKKTKNIIIPITLSLAILIAILGPLSSFSFAIRSQNDRFDKILLENNMLVDNTIVSNPSIPSESKKEITNIINYFESYHHFKDLKSLPENFTVSNMESIFGFPYNPYDYYQDQYFYHNLNTSGGLALDISNYDYYINISTWNEQIISAKDLDIKYNRNSNELTINQGEEVLLSQNVLDYVLDIYKNSDIEVMKEGMTSSVDDMSVEIENEKIKARLIFTSISGQVKEDGIILESADMILLLKVKS